MAPSPARGPRLRAEAALAAFWLAPALVASSGCGYHAVYGATPEERFSVALVGCHVTEPTACDEVVAGVRERLAREGALLDGNGYPRVAVEVLRLDEASDAWIPPAAGSPETAPPVGRSLALGLVARGWLERTAGATPERDTGDLRAFGTVSSTTSGGTFDSRAALLNAQDVYRAVGRRLGHRIGFRVLGDPVPTDESAGVER